MAVQGQWGEKNMDVDGQGGGGGALENWTIFMDVTCVTSLQWKTLPKKWEKKFFWGELVWGKLDGKLVVVVVVVWGDLTKR